MVVLTILLQFETSHTATLPAVCYYGTTAQWMRKRMNKYDVSRQIHSIAADLKRLC
jgi:hypothetical protein